MKKLSSLRWWLLSITSVFGILAIVATSPSPPFYNSVRGDFIPKQLCANGTGLMRWYTNNENVSVRISGEPTQGSVPAFNNSAYDTTGIHAVTISKKLTITVTPDPLFDQSGGQEGAPSSNVPFGARLSFSPLIIPQTVCESFPIDPIGVYSGTLEQSKPQAATTEQLAQIYWDIDHFWLETYAMPRGSQLYSYWTPQQRIKCDAMAKDGNLTCKTVNASFNGKVTSTGYQGAYTLTSKVNSVVVQAEGTFDFKPYRP